MYNKKLTNIQASLSTNPSNSTYMQYNRDLLQTEIDKEWAYATDIFSIEEETTRGTNIFSSTEVRINHVVSEKNLGKKLGDDWRTLIFKNIDHVFGMGHKYRFNDNYWLTVRTDIYKFVTASTTVRRCNNVLRWIDEYGNKIEEPCVINYDLKNTKNDDNMNILVPKGDIEVIVQYNNRTKLIHPNQRFLFGDPRKAYRVRGDGVNNYLNQKTMDDTSVPLVYLYMDTHQINLATDDIINGYADVNLLDYSIKINQDSFNQVVGGIGQLICTKLLNGIPDEFDVMWTSSDSDIATIDNLGNYTLLNVGNVVFTCSMVDNSDIYDSVSISVDDLPINDTQIIIDNQVVDIYQGSSEIYGVFLYIDGIIQSDLISINTSGVPQQNYNIEILDSNHFKITNITAYKNSQLYVEFSSGSYSKNIDINLKGVW